MRPFKRVMKYLLQKESVRNFAAFFLAGYIRFVHATSRKVYHFDNLALPYLRGERNAIFVFWHGRLMLCPYLGPKERPMRVLTSHHRDGRLIAEVLTHFGHDSIRGSTSRGGAKAAKAILRALKNGDNVAITPDGPRGPNRLAAPGIVRIAALSQTPLLPITFYSDHAKIMNSWDRFMVALPFGRIVFCAGAPLTLEGDIEAMRSQIESTLDKQMEQVDALLSA